MLVRFVTAFLAEGASMASTVRWGVACALAAAVLAQAGSAAAGEGPSQVASPFHPFAARLRLGPGSARATYRDPLDTLGPRPTLPPSTSPVGRQAAQAHAALLPSLFAPAGPEDPALDVEITVTRARLEADSEGWYAAVVHDAVLRSPDGAELGRWRVEGRGRLEGTLAGTVPRAFEEAAHAAARQFGLALRVEPTAAWSRWLAERGLEPPVSEVEPLRLQLQASRPAPRPPRDPRAWFVETGLSPVLAGKAFSFAALVRAGRGGEHLIAAASLRYWPSEISTSPLYPAQAEYATLRVTELGAELAWRAWSAADFEVRLGAGVQVLLGSGTAHYRTDEAPDVRRSSAFSGSCVAGSLLAGARYFSTLEALGGRFRGGVDLRKELWAKLPLRSSEVALDLTVVEWSVVFVIGLEWPAGSLP